MKEQNSFKQENLKMHEYFILKILFLLIIQILNLNVYIFLTQSIKVKNSILNKIYQYINMILALNFFSSISSKVLFEYKSFKFNWILSSTLSTTCGEVALLSIGISLFAFGFEIY